MNTDRRLSYRQAIILATFVLVALGVAMLFYEKVLELKPGVALDGKLNDVQSRAIQVTLDLIQLIMSWTVALLGVSGFFLKMNFEKKSSLSQIDLLLTLLIVVAAVISLYFGHLAMDRTAGLLAIDQFPIGKLELRRLCQYQYLSFFVAVMLFGLHIFQFFWPRTAAQPFISSGGKEP